MLQISEVETEENIKEEWVVKREKMLKAILRWANASRKQITNS